MPDPTKELFKSKRSKIARKKQKNTLMKEMSQNRVAKESQNMGYKKNCNCKNKNKQLRRKNPKLKSLVTIIFRTLQNTTKFLDNKSKTPKTNSRSLKAAKTTTQPSWSFQNMWLNYKTIWNQSKGKYKCWT